MSVVLCCAGILYHYTVLAREIAVVNYSQLITCSGYHNILHIYTLSGFMYAHCIYPHSSRLGFVLDPASISDDLQDLNLTLPIASRTYVHYSGSALVRPTCADSLIRVMDRERRVRLNSQGTTLGRGDFANLDYMGEIMSEGQTGNTGVGVTRPGGRHACGSDEESKWSLTNEGIFIANSTPLVSDCFDEAHHPPGNKEDVPRSNFSSSPLRCGFYWYWNTSLSRHKGVVTHTNTGGVSSEHGSLREKMASLCSNTDGCLSQLCRDELNIDCSDVTLTQSQSNTEQLFI